MSTQGKGRLERLLGTGLSIALFLCAPRGGGGESDPSLTTGTGLRVVMQMESWRCHSCPIKTGVRMPCWRIENHRQEEGLNMLDIHREGDFETARAFYVNQCQSWNGSVQERAVPYDTSGSVIQTWERKIIILFINEQSQQNAIDSLCPLTPT